MSILFGAALACVAAVLVAPPVIRAVAPRLARRNPR
jgi:hypothetical protein